MIAGAAVEIFDALVATPKLEPDLGDLLWSAVDLFHHATDCQLPARWDCRNRSGVRPSSGLRCTSAYFSVHDRARSSTIELGLELTRHFPLNARMASQPRRLEGMRSCRKHDFDFGVALGCDEIPKVAAV